MSSDNTRILLLGKTGFVGRNIYEYLTPNDNYDIVAPSHGELDVLDEKSVFTLLKTDSYDVVLNCLDIHAESDAAYAEKRLRMFFNLAHHADLYGKMVYFGTGAELGSYQRALVKVEEEDFGKVIPLDSYGFAMFQMALHALQSENIYNLRLFGIFGPYELWRSRFISNCICKTLFGYPLSIRQDRIMDYLYTDDLCKIVEWLICSKPDYHVYNASTGAAQSLLDLANKVRQQGSVDVPIFVAREGFANEYTSSNDRLKRELGGFIPESIEASIDKLFAFYRSNYALLDKESLLYNR